MIKLSPSPDFRAESAAILGCTGSVGRQTESVLLENGIRTELLAGGCNTAVLEEQIKKLSPKIVCVRDEKAAVILSGEFPHLEILNRADEILEAVEKTDADIIFNSVGGLAGLPYSIAAAKSGKRIGMANKESIIADGENIFSLCEKSGAEIIPVDSEHCAVFRCLEGHSYEDVYGITLTASGGPFFGWTKEMLSSVTPDDALRHPTWKMGAKITIDCATLMNKGFEIIEAAHLFGIPESRIDVVVHRQSIIHSLVEMNDGAMLAQLGRPDMSDCICYALTSPHTVKNDHRLNLAEVSSLTFDKPDTEAFPLLDTAREAYRAGGTAPVTLIAADEEAVKAFIERRISFTDISSVVIETMNRSDVSYDGIESISEAECEARRISKDIIKSFGKR